MTTTDAAPQLLRDDPHWYKDAIIYQLHVKAFNDSTNHGCWSLLWLMTSSVMTRRPRRCASRTKPRKSRSVP